MLCLLVARKRRSENLNIARARVVVRYLLCRISMSMSMHPQVTHNRLTPSEGYKCTLISMKRRRRYRSRIQARRLSPHCSCVASLITLASRIGSLPLDQQRSDVFGIEKKNRGKARIVRPREQTTSYYSLALCTAESSIGANDYHWMQVSEQEKLTSLVVGANRPQRA